MEERMLVGVLAGLTGLLIVNAALATAAVVIGRSLVGLVGGYLEAMRDVLDRAELDRTQRRPIEQPAAAPPVEADAEEFTFLPPES